MFMIKLYESFGSWFYEVAIEETHSEHIEDMRMQGPAELLFTC